MTTQGSGSDSDKVDAWLGTLMRDAQAGDRQAYAALLRDCEPIIRRAAHRLGLSPDRADDIVQETLLTLHHARHTYDPSRSFTAWLSVIARRRAIDALRRDGRNARREIHAPLVYERHADPGADSARSVENADRATTLRLAIDALTPSQQEAVEHLSLHGLTLAEASTKTGKTVGALKVNFHRALKTLRARLSASTDPSSPREERDV